MAATSDDFFTNVAIGFPGIHAWVNSAAILVEAGGAGVSFDDLNDSQTVTLDTPLAGVEVPIDATVTNIQITLQCYREDPSPGIICYPGNVTLEPGTPQNDATDMGLIPAPFVYTGDLSFWGISNAEALEFAAGTSALTLQFRDNTGTASGFDAFLLFAKCQFIYEPLFPGRIIYPPVLF
jgi:hypothetical protein